MTCPITLSGSGSVATSFSAYSWIPGCIQIGDVCHKRWIWSSKADTILLQINDIHYDVMTWKRFSHSCPFVRGIHRCGFPSQRVQWCADWMFSLLFSWASSIANTLQVRLFCINSLGPSDAIWRWRSWSTLVQVMVCCLTAPSHYLNQCWLIISKVLWHSSEDITIRRFEDTNQ